MKTVLDIAKAVAIEAGLDEPTSISGTDDDARKLLRFINETGMELERRVDWRALNKSATLTGDGVASTFNLASDYSRLSAGLAVKADGNVRGGLTTDEWLSLEPLRGVPRYFYLTAVQIGFYPYPASTKTVTVSYQSANWAKSNAGVGKREFDADDDEPLFPCQLIVRGAMWRWMRHVGRDFSDQMAEFEAQLTDYAGQEGGVRAP